MLPAFSGVDEKCHQRSPDEYKLTRAFCSTPCGAKPGTTIGCKVLDRERMQLFIERAKGKKNRYVGLSPVSPDVLRNYIMECKHRPTIYLFEGAGTRYALRGRDSAESFPGGV